jgi:hypothetical protein
MKRRLSAPILALITLILAGCNVVNMPQSMNFSFEQGIRSGDVL